MSEGCGPLAALEFTKRDGTYRASVPVSELALLTDDPAETMRVVTAIYQRALDEIRQWQRKAQSLRDSKMPLPARMAWLLGDVVFRLEADMEQHSCHIVGLYDHLAQHAGTPGWLGSFHTFRRYVDDLDSVPENLKWNSIAKRAKAAGQAIAAGRQIEG